MCIIHIIWHTSALLTMIWAVDHWLRYTVLFAFLPCPVGYIANKPYSCLHCLIMSFCLLRSGSGHHLCQSGRPRGVAVWCESALWTFRTASDRKPADASWLPNEQLLSDRTQPQRGQTASRSTSQKPRHGFEVHGFILSAPLGPPPPNTSSWRHIQPPPTVLICHRSSTVSSSVAILWAIPTEATLGKISVENASFLSA